jgi:hypothetical protein
VDLLNQLPDNFCHTTSYYLPQYGTKFLVRGDGIEGLSEMSNVKSAAQIYKTQ